MLVPVYQKRNCIHAMHVRISCNVHGKKIISIFIIRKSGEVKRRREKNRNKNKQKKTRFLIKKKK